MRLLFFLRRFGGVLAFFVLATAWSADDGARLVVRIGHHEITKYTVRKHLDRFLAGARPGGECSDPAGKWLGDYLAKQVVIADLESRGYLQRREVCDQVARMERHMLSATYGPYYDRVVASGVVPPAAAELLAGPDGTTATLAGVVFASEAAARVSLGDDFEVVDDSEKMRRLALGCSQPEATRLEGRTLWWQDPLLSLVDQPSWLTPGTWFSGVETEAGWAYFKVLSVDRGEEARSPAAASRREELRRRVLVKAHRRARLRAAQVQFDAGAVLRLMASLNQRTSGTDIIAHDLLPEGADAPLFSYAAGNGRTSVSLGEFADFYNGLFVRCMPESLMDFRALAVEMVIGRLDLASVEAAAVAQAAGFLRDKRDFAGLTALALYERDELLPTIRITEDEIETHYQARSADYLRPSCVHGWRVRFGTAAEASAWMDAVGGVVDEPALVAAGGERVSFAFEEPVPDFEGHRPLLFDPGVSKVFVGPVDSSSGVVVLYKTGVGGFAPAPLAEVRQQLVGRLQQDRIDATERVIAIGLCAQFEIVDALVPVDFGIAGKVFKPWAQ